MLSGLLSWKFLLPAILVSGLFLWHEIDVQASVRRAEKATEARVSKEMQKAYDDLQKENERLSTDLENRIITLRTENADLKRKARNAISKPDAPAWDAPFVCLLRQARGYPASPACKLSGKVPAASRPRH